MNSSYDKIIFLWKNIINCVIMYCVKRCFA